MTELYLALGGATKNLRSSFCEQPAPAVLLSYVYFNTFAEFLESSQIRYWVLDSGAFTAHQQGKPIELGEYIDFCKRVMAGPLPPKEIYGLDVIGDWQATVRNIETMWKEGVPAIPTFHIGEPEEILVEFAAKYPKLALGGVAGMGKRAIPWLRQCFARVWPKPMHCFGIHAKEVLMTLPFHSADATNWQAAPTRYGRWKCYGDYDPKIRTGFHLRPQVNLYLELERQLQAKWKRELKRFEGLAL